MFSIAFISLTMGVRAQQMSDAFSLEPNFFVKYVKETENSQIEVK